MYSKRLGAAAAVMLAASFLTFHNSFAQASLYENLLQDQGVITGGVGVSVIDGQSYFTMSLRPDLAFGKWGIGLDIPLRFDVDTGNLRNEDWDQGYDYLRLFRYVRYSRKRNPDPVYARIGSLDAARLGHGFIMNYYSNSLIIDQRKVGMEFDFDFGIGGFETVTNNFGRGEIFGGRIYYRPLQLATNAPILRNFAIGATYVSDIDPDEYRGTDNGVSEFGFDAELPIVQTPLLRLAIYGDVAKINNHGSGKATGIELNLTGLANLFDVGAQLERRFLNREFLPSYFGPLYELERRTKEDTLDAQRKKLRGTYGLLYGHVLNTLRLVGSFERLDGVPQSGRLHLEATIPDAVPNIAMRAYYDDTRVDKLSDVFNMDENSAARVGIGYKLNQFLILYMDYAWTFTFDQAAQKYKVQRRFEPQLAFAYTFPLGGGR